MKSFIEESKNIIYKASKNNKLVVFVGSGVSMNSGFPSWPSLINDFAKGIGINIKDITSDDYLKIPQYYYNLRKEKEYYDIILNKFNIISEPNKIHDLILELDPAHIVTTNYDDLIEKASNKKGLFFDVVAKDSDLPYSVNNKMIIKMHGDLKNKNIVLKEDDYLSYFKNFQLIQNYIKSLLSTHVVLFIGYSISDMNVKYIFQWVKDILKKDFQQVYFLEGNKDKKFNQLEFEYYRNRGINILYSSECEEIEYFNKDFDYGGLNNETAKSTIEILTYLTDNESCTNLTVDIAYEKLKPLDALNILHINDIRLALGLNEPWKDEKAIYFTYYKFDGNILKVQNKKLQNLFKELSTYRLDNKGNCIKKILYNAGVRTIVDEENAIILDIDCDEDINLNEDIYLFNYKKLISSTRDSMYKSLIGREKEYLDIAYKLYVLGNYYESYNLFKLISKSCIENKLYYLYFISEFNRYHIGDIISRNPFDFNRFGIDAEIQECIKSEVKKIDLNNIYLKLPKIDRFNIDVYRDILNFKFAHKKIGDVVSIEKKIEEEKDIIFCVVDNSKVGSIYKLINEMKFFGEFIVGNRLCVNNYIEVKSSFYKFVENIIFSYSLEEKYVEETFFGMSGKRPKLYKIDYFTIYSMINYLNIKEIKYLFEKYNIDSISVEDDAFSKLNKLNYNLAYALNNIDSISDIKEKYCKFIYIISKLKLNTEKFDFNLVIKYFIEIVEFNYSILTSNIIKEISNSIDKQFKRSQEILDDNIVKNLLNNLFITIRYIKNNNDIVSSIESFILNVMYIIHDKKIDIDEKDEVAILEYLNYSENSDYIYYRIILKSYSILSEKNKNLITDKIKTILKNKDIYSYNEFSLYEYSIFTDIIEPDITQEQKLIDFIDLETQMKKHGNKEVYCGVMYKLNDLLKSIFYLLYYNKIIEVDNFKKYSEYSELIKFILEDMNIEIFNPKWIVDLHDDLNKTLSSNEEIKKEIEKYIKSNLNKDGIKDIMEIYFKYYCN